MRFAYLSVSPLCVITSKRWYGNVDPLSIAFAHTLRLRPDLPYVDQRCVGNLGLSVPWILTRVVATHAGILTSQRSIPTYVKNFKALGTLPYLLPTIVGRTAASVIGLAPLHFRRKTPRPVSCYALFKGWLLLSQPPSCFSGLTAFHT